MWNFTILPSSIGLNLAAIKHFSNQPKPVSFPITYFEKFFLFRNSKINAFRGNTIIDLALAYVTYDSQFDMQLASERFLMKT